MAECGAANARTGNYASYIHNRYINYSNISHSFHCQFCAFAARKRDPHAFEFAIEEIARVVREALPLGITEESIWWAGFIRRCAREWRLDSCCASYARSTQDLH